MAAPTDTFKYSLPSSFPEYPNNTRYNFSVLGQDGNLTLDDTLQSLLSAAESNTSGLVPGSVANGLENLDLYSMLPSPTGSPAATNPGFFSQIGSGIKSVLGLTPTHTLEDLQAMGPEKLEALKVQNWERLLNRQAFGQTLQGLNSLMSGYLGYQGMKQAKDALDFQRTSWAKNFENQRRSYNTELEDKYRRSAGMSSNFSEADLNEYMKKNSL